MNGTSTDSVASNSYVSENGIYIPLFIRDKVEPPDTIGLYGQQCVAPAILPMSKSQKEIDKVHRFIFSHVSVHI